MLLDKIPGRTHIEQFLACYGAGCNAVGGGSGTSINTGTLFGGGRSGSGERLEVEGFVDHGPCCCWFVGGMRLVV